MALDRSGFDLFSLPSNARLAWFDMERCVDSLVRCVRLGAHRLLMESLVQAEQFNLESHVFNGQTHAVIVVGAIMFPGTLVDATNVVLVGPNGVGKSMLACNLGHQALVEGKTVLFATAGQLLGDLAALDSDTLLRRRIRNYAAPDLLLIDEVGYLSYSNRHADLLFDLFEVISRRYEHKSTVITTNRAF